MRLQMNHPLARNSRTSCEWHAFMDDLEKFAVHGRHLWGGNRHTPSQNQGYRLLTSRAMLDALAIPSSISFSIPSTENRAQIDKRGVSDSLRVCYVSWAMQLGLRSGTSCVCGAPEAVGGRINVRMNVTAVFAMCAPMAVLFLLSVLMLVSYSGQWLLGLWFVVIRFASFGSNKAWLTAKNTTIVSVGAMCVAECSLCVRVLGGGRFAGFL